MVLKNGPHRILLGVYLMVAVVVSNAFKNENITHITLPLEPIPFDNFDILLDHGFDIYTRGTAYGNTAIYEEQGFRSMVYAWLKPKNYTDQHLITNVFMSEVYMFGKGQTSFRNWQSWLYPSSSMPGNIRRVMNHTKLFSTWFETLIFGTHTEYDVLQSCNKTALFLPDLEAHALYYQLKQKGLNAFLGEKLGFVNQQGILFARWVNPTVFKRFDGLYMAGIWDWWTKILVKFMIQVKGHIVMNEKKRPQASNIYGNISIVFILGSFGNLISCIIFLIELGRRRKGGMGRARATKVEAF